MMQGQIVSGAFGCLFLIASRDSPAWAPNGCQKPTVIFRLLSFLYENEYAGPGATCGSVARLPNPADARYDHPREHMTVKELLTRSEDISDWLDQSIHGLEMEVTDRLRLSGVALTRSKNMSGRLASYYGTD